MMKHSSLIRSIVLMNIFFCQASLALFGSLFKKPHEQVKQQEFKIDKHGSLTVKNNYGDVVIKGWKQNSIHMTATKQSSKEELLPSVAIAVQATDKNVIIVTKQPNDTKQKVRVNYELLVPETITMQIANKEGTTTISNTHGQIKTQTKKGNVEIIHAAGPVVTNTDCGHIKINKSSGNIRATAHNGNISIDESSKNVFAKTEKGTIRTCCKNLNSLDTISLSTQSGSIILELPETVNADLQARTGRGKLTSDHYITTKPQTVQLNKKTWSRFRKEVTGTLGSGEATIRLSAKFGNIKITKTT